MGSLRKALPARQSTPHQLLIWHDPAGRLISRGGPHAPDHSSVHHSSKLHTVHSIM
jgi:hypothetical protein